MQIALNPLAMRDLSNILFSNCSKMKKIKTIVDEIANTDISILIKGESGTGKEFVAQAIHLNSHRREKPFIKVNCAAIPMGLLESELFGFEKGAFTGAYLKKPGKFELANEGTILLNEIGEIDISIQAKLLQVLQDGTFSRLGGDGSIGVNSRVITTTKDHLEMSVREGRFREDLFFRINVMTLALPPLRDRTEQIIPLSQYFFDEYRTKYKKTLPLLSAKTISLFKEYHWPGNIRELENLIKRIVIFGDEEMVIKDLNHQKSDGEKDSEPFEDCLANSSKEKDILNLKEVGRRAAEAAEREIIQTTLYETHWNRKEAAKLLRVSYKALLYKIQKYHLDEIKGCRRID
jgi:transcriptional regulator with PAS, ATPase and Fis domain